MCIRDRLDVDELLGPEVGAEPGFGDDEVGEAQAEFGGGAVSYTHLTPPTSDLVLISVGAPCFKKKVAAHALRLDTYCQDSTLLRCQHVSRSI